MDEFAKEAFWGSNGKEKRCCRDHILPGLLFAKQPTITYRPLCAPKRTDSHGKRGPGFSRRFAPSFGVNPFFPAARSRANCRANAPSDGGGPRSPEREDRPLGPSRLRPNLTTLRSSFFPAARSGANCRANAPSGAFGAESVRTHRTRGSFPRQGAGRTNNYNAESWTVQSRRDGQD